MSAAQKLQNLSVTHILREIKVGKSRDSKSVILNHLDALNFDIYIWILVLFEGWNIPN